jgi:hypothetical protein
MGHKVSLPPNDAGFELIYKCENLNPHLRTQILNVSISRKPIFSVQMDSYAARAPKLCFKAIAAPIVTRTAIRMARNVHQISLGVGVFIKAIP